MMADPNPNKTFITFFSDSSVCNANTSGPKYASFLQMKGRMSRILLQERKIFICELLNVLWKTPIMIPEIG
jgi:hypothetical protein